MKLLLNDFSVFVSTFWTRLDSFVVCFVCCFVSMLQNRLILLVEPTRESTTDGGCTHVPHWRTSFHYTPWNQYVQTIWTDVWCYYRGVGPRMKFYIQAQEGVDPVWRHADQFISTLCLFCFTKNDLWGFFSLLFPAVAAHSFVFTVILVQNEQIRNDLSINQSKEILSPNILIIN